MVRTVDSGGVIQRISVDPTPTKIKLDPPQRGDTEVASLPDHLGAQLIRIDPDGVVCTVPNCGVRLGFSFDVGADTAVEQQIHWSAQDGANEFRRSHLGDLLVNTQRLANARTDRDRLLLTAEHPTPGADQAGVVILPTRSREIEQPTPLLKRASRVRVGIDEDVPVVKGRNQPDVLGEQHAVAEHVTTHVADTGDGEILGLGIDPHLTEMTPDRLPGTLGGDAHRLVVIADRTTGGERVTEPKPVGVGDVVGDIGEGRGALVRGDNKIGVVAVTAHHPRRSHHLSTGPLDLTGTLDPTGTLNIVGDVEQAGHEQPVAGDSLVARRLPVQCVVAGERRGIFDDEPPLGADRNDDRIFHGLRLDQAQDLGPEILSTITPAQPATCDRTKSQMNTLDPGRVDEDLEFRTRKG